MTKDEAKDFLCSIARDLRLIYGEDYTSKDGTKMRDAIEILEQEQCNDVISRQAVLNTLDSTDKFLDETRTVESYKTLLEECYKNLPSVTPTRKKGKWEYSGSYDVEGMLYCSCCKHEIDVSEGYFKYCPNCGCKMSEGEKE